MTGNTAARNPLNYRIGIDVGTHSVGLAAIEFNELGRPVSILSAISHIHDSGVLEAKTATTRLAASGVARRVRRLRRRRIKRLVALDQQLDEWGWSALPDNGDPYLPWRARQRLVAGKIFDESERNSHLATALRHMARHRGWRNPYVRVGSLYEVADSSPFMVGVPATDRKEAVSGFKQRVENQTGLEFSDDVTIAELAVAAIDHDRSIPLRHGKTEKAKVEKSFSYIGGKLMQSDNANELHAYARVQGLTDELLHQMIDLVFAAESPRGSWVGRVGKDPLDHHPRASKATDAFQRFRIVSTLANVRLREPGSDRPLSVEELHRAYEYLTNQKPGEQPTWGDIGEVIGKARGSMAGVASTNASGEERLPLRPPILTSDHVIRKLKKLGSLRDFWMENDSAHRDALVALIVDGAKDESSPEGIAAWELLNSLSEDELTELDKLDLPAGRAAYSLGSLRKLTSRMLEQGEDLHSARKAVYGVPDDWAPPAEPIGAPIGNPAVDRVLKIVARFIMAAEAEWGAPQQVTIEHVRDAFRSELSVREAERDNERRFKAKLEQRESVGKSLGSSSRIRESDVRRFEAVTRQHGLCLYCGDQIDYDTAEMDHIVPRKGPGSTNTRTNLAAVCVDCNRSKTNLPFAVWATKTNKPGVSVKEASDRTRHWIADTGINRKTWTIFLKEVRDRLERTEDDPEIDSRSMESVAWMANELRDRIDLHLKGVSGTGGAKQVAVYRGALTANARRASGIEGKIPWIGGGGKTRLDRRHHAVDAAVQTLLDDSVARTLAERISLRDAERFRKDGLETWKAHTGSTPAAQSRFADWRSAMEDLSGLLAAHFRDDRVVVMQNLRLRLGSGRIHEDTVHPMVRKRLGDAFSPKEVDAASTPQLWIALTRDPDYTEKDGLPKNDSRRLRLQGTWFDADDTVDLFDKPRAALAVRGGWAALGDSIHHARIYRWTERGKVKYAMLRVFAADLMKHRHEDLFNVVPDPSWISMRVAHPSIGKSDLSEKDYIGWLVAGDEVLVTSDPPETPSLGQIKRWKVLGYEGPTLLNLEPVQLAAEGLDRFLESSGLVDLEADEVADLVGKIRRYTVNTFFNAAGVVVIRRDALGRPRLQSSANLPTSWDTR